MAIQIRRGNYENFDPQKMKPGELAVVQSNDPEGDGTAVYYCVAPGNTKRLVSFDDVTSIVYTAVDDVIEEVQGIADYIEETAGDVTLHVVESYARPGQTALSATWLATGSSSGPVIVPEQDKIYTLMQSSGDYAAKSQFKWGGTTYVKINDGGFVNVTGVKGDAEQTYRQGDINITPENIGALKSENIKQDGITGAIVNRYATCSNSASTAAKTATIGNGTFALEAGTRVTVNFSYTNTADNPTLNINGTGAKTIYLNGSQITTGDEKRLLSGIVDLIYNGSTWNLLVDVVGTTYITNAEIDAIVSNTN